MQTISPRELAGLHGRDPSLELIDVRMPAEYGEVHCPFARNVPLSDLDAAGIAASRKAAAGGGGEVKPLYVICQSGSRGGKACDALRAAGLANVVNVEGGTRAWVEAGLPVVRGRKAVSLERQVRIAAGLLVLTGVALAWFVHPYLIGITAFVGTGLVFAGVTDWCGMGLLLARMPWNRAPAACGTAVPSAAANPVGTGTAATEGAR